MSEIVYQPSEHDLTQSHIVKFIDTVNKKHNASIVDYESCHQWSIEHKEHFWLSLCDYCQVHFHQTGDEVIKDEADFMASSWFDGYTLNYAQHVLKNTSNNTAIFFKSEDKVSKQLSFKELNQQVSSVQQYFQDIGVVEGDRIAGYLPNMPETVVCMLAASSLGAVWSSCSPDFGAQGVIDRFGQIEPTVFISANYYFYNGKKHDCTANTSEIIQQINSIKHHILVEFEAKNEQQTQQTTLASILIKYPSKECFFQSLEFNHPLFIMYSSGTTGVPKCIVHGAGGTLLQHLKEHQLHSDFKANDTVFYFTTCGWMMWNWLVTALASNCSIALYDGSPFYPKATVLWEWLDHLNVAHFGTSAKYIDALKNENVNIKQQFKLLSLRSILSTGSPLLNECYDYVYQSIKSDVRLVSMSGGTDILSCFALGVPIKPILKGQLQCLGLGMDVVILDDDGNSVVQQKGELSCQTTFPCKPIYFWQDLGNEKYKQSYFSKVDNVWCHGDYAEITAERGLIIYGRSDATLNPCGVRIGTAEIYRQVEQLSEIKESIVIGQQWQGDVRIVLFVVLNDSHELTNDLITKIKRQIRNQTTPRHVPAVILEVTDIPRTKSGKIVEIAVNKVVAGETINNLEALANPNALAQFENRAELSV